MSDVISIPTGNIHNRRSVDAYVERKKACPDHNYVGQGWPQAVRLAGILDEADDVVGCVQCYSIWRVVHINPGKANAGV